MQDPQPVEIRSNDGTANLSAEAWAAWVSRDYLPVGSEPRDSGACSPSVAGDVLTREQVQAMLGEKSWKLAVPYDGGYEVLDRGTLEDAPPITSVQVSSGAGEELLEALGRWFSGTAPPERVKPAETIHRAVLRDSTADEKSVLDAQTAAAASPLAQLSVAGLLPITSTLVGTVGGGLGLVAVRDNLEETAMAIAIVLGTAAIVIAVIANYLTTTRVRRLSRLDLLEAREESIIRRQGWRAQWPLAFFLSAVVAAAAAVVVPTFDAAPPDATITLASTTESSAGEVRAELGVAWTGLTETATKVRTTVWRGATDVARNDAPKGSAGTAAQELEITGTGEYEVRTMALDAAGKVVGRGFIRSVTVR